MSLENAPKQEPLYTGQGNVTMASRWSIWFDKLVKFVNAPSFDYITFNNPRTTSVPTAPYTLSSNSTDGTLDLQMGYDAVTLQLGMEQYHPPVVNKTGAIIPNGTLVMWDPVNKVQGNRLCVTPAVTNGTYPPQYVMGVTTMEFAINATGLITWYGEVRDIKMADIKANPGETWAEGDRLWGDPVVAGKFTNVQPNAPNLKMAVGQIDAINGANIRILARVLGYGSYISSIHDVDTGKAKTTPVDADVLLLQDSADSSIWKKLTWANTKATLKAYFDGIYVVANGAISGATKTKITYDSKGLVTSGADATTADIADSTNKRYVTDAQLVVIGNTSGTNTGDETTQRIGNLINSATEKTTPVDADMLGLMDSEASNILKKLSWSNVKAKLKTYFDSLYLVLAGVSGGQTAAGGTGVTDKLVLKGTTGNGTATSAAFQVNVGNNGATNAITALNNGKVGIMETAPVSELHVTKAQAGAITAIAVDNAGGGDAGTGTGFLHRYTGTGVIGGLYNVFNGSAWFARLKVWNSSAEQERFTINGTSGNIGCNNTDPSYGLDNLGTLRTGGSSNYTKFEADGTMQAIGDATCWDDVYPSSVTVGGGASAPSYTVYNGGNLRAYEFLGTGVIVKELNIGFQFNHSQKTSGTMTISPHAHLYVPDNATGGDIKFGLEYEWSAIGDTGASSTTTIYGTITRAANAGIAKNIVLEFTDISATGKGISSILMCRLFRDPADAGDTFGASVWLMMADVHIEKDMLGSRQEYVK